MSRFGQQFLPEVEVRGYVTAFVDLLGLSNKLLQLDALCDPQNHANAKQIIGRSLAPVRTMRRAFEDFYRSFESHRDPVMEEQVHNLPLPLQQLWNETHTYESVVHWFSDCVSVSVPISENSDLTTMRGIFSMFSSLSVVYLQMLAMHQAIRGGVEVGYGVEITQGEVIGSSLAKAYRVEQVARYPRICIGGELLGMVEHYARQDTSEPPEVLCKFFACSSKECLMTDLDGAVCINPLNTRFLKALDRNTRARIIYNAFVFVHQEVRTARDSQNQSLLKKYEWLRDSFARIDLESCMQAASKDLSD